MDEGAPGTLLDKEERDWLRVASSLFSALLKDPELEPAVSFVVCVLDQGVSDFTASSSRLGLWPERPGGGLASRFLPRTAH